jgi:hypothetical protein
MTEQIDITLKCNGCGQTITVRAYKSIFLWLAAHNRCGITTREQTNMDKALDIRELVNTG